MTSRAQISLVNQTINFTAPTSQISFSPNEQVTLSASGGASGNPVVFTIDSSSTGSGSINGDVLTITGAGTFVLDANQTGNSDYNAAPGPADAGGQSAGNQTCDLDFDV